MPLIQNTYGKGQVRVLRVRRDTARHEVRELSVRTMLQGDFAASYTAGDNHAVVATDSIKNITNIVARENLTASAELFGAALASRFLERYPQVARVTVEMQETVWRRASVGGVPHHHSFVLDSNGKPFAAVSGTREATTTISGINGFTFMKTTQSGWVEYVKDEYTTLPETTDRIAATAMDAHWSWRAPVEDYTISNALVLSTMLDVFASTYSRSVQDSLYRMGEAALAAVPELATISLACPNKHYLPINLSPFGLSSDNMVFTPTDEPHGQIECVVGRVN
ncbi:factor-independent urate hydroxylase [Rhodopila sp.]|uniref:factor-independent urate hydroxylase n=1 Tax=Rhodopila sp. TaxID=2480087 RepID=UPI003D130459